MTIQKSENEVELIKQNLERFGEDFSQLTKIIMILIEHDSLLCSEAEYELQRKRPGFPITVTRLRLPDEGEDGEEIPSGSVSIKIIYNLTVNFL